DPPWVCCPQEHCRCNTACCVVEMTCEAADLVTEEARSLIAKLPSCLEGPDSWSLNGVGFAAAIFFCLVPARNVRERWREENQQWPAPVPQHPDSHLDGMVSRANVIVTNCMTVEGHCRKKASKVLLRRLLERAAYRAN